MAGIGVDLVEIARLAAAMRRREGFAEMAFTTGERSYAGRRHPAKRFAACFAAKEAFLKAVGVGLWGGVPLQEVEVVHEVSGQPRLRLGPLAERALRRKGCSSTLLSLSHEKRAAVAVVLVQ